MGSPRASIVVRCYNEAEHIGKLLHGISEQTMQDYEIVLVDSGSTDGTLEIAREFGVDKIEYIEPENFSFGRALNYGCKAAEGEYCVIASAHVYPTREDWLEQLLAKFEDDEEVALVYGKQRGNDVTTFSENQIFKQWFPEHDIDHQPHPFCNNANAAIRRDLWEEFPYDEHLTGLEDVDWAKRVQKAGYEISYVSEAEIIHVHDETASEVLNRYRREAYAHKEIMPEQSFSLFDFLRLSIQNIVSDYRAALEEGELTAHLLEIPKFRLMQFWGTYRGFTKQGPISDSLWQRFFYPDRNSYPPDRDAADSNETEVADEIEYPDSDTFLDIASRGRADD
jgi:glycosyltransferase involved in cell wall biosynthesis